MLMETADKIARMKELCDILTKASEHYYAYDEEIMSNYEYDKLSDELTALEEETGVVLAASPSNKVGYEAVDSLPKMVHEKPMLSLGKTKSREELRDWLGSNTGLLSWKLDGLTVVLTYDNGELSMAVTRGNGQVGELVTNNAKTFMNVPRKISYKGHLVIRGEAVIGYKDFEAINRNIPDGESKYKNPRNLCSGSVRQLNSKVTAERRVRFFAFSLVEAEGVDFDNSHLKQMEFLKEQGFETVFNKVVNKDNILEAIEYFEKEILVYDIPSDGLVLVYDDIAYGKSLGTTLKAPKNAIAFKWADEIAETTLREIEWSPSRTGLINPVAIFDEVELEGTTVKRASVHNVSVLRSLKLGIGDKIRVYKANMIIPQIEENLTKSNNVEIPKTCPTCGGETELKNENDVMSLYCINPECPVKHIKSMTHFTERDALNIEGLSEMTIEKFVQRGYIKTYVDFFHLDRYKDEIVGLDGFGIKSYENIIASVEKSKDVELSKLIYGLGIENIGLATARIICDFFDDDIEKIINASEEEVAQADKVGDVIAGTFCEYFRNEENMAVFKALLEEVRLIHKEKADSSNPVFGKTFVITGTLNNYKDRSELKDIIVSRGGKVSGSVSSKTHALINNDVESSSSKNKTAKELGVRIISEEDFIKEFLS